MDRKQWLAVRDSGSLGQLFRSRSRFIHISKTLTRVMGPDGLVRVAVTPRPGDTLTLGRNKAKRAARKGVRKCWRWIGRAG